MPNPYGPKAPPILRLPGGGYFAYSTTRSASSRALIIGTTTPHAPASRAHLNHSTLLAGHGPEGGTVPACRAGGRHGSHAERLVGLCLLAGPGPLQHRCPARDTRVNPPELYQ